MAGKLSPPDGGFKLKNLLPGKAVITQDIFVVLLLIALATSSSVSGTLVLAHLVEDVGASRGSGKDPEHAEAGDPDDERNNRHDAEADRPPLGYVALLVRNQTTHGISPPFR